MPANKKYLTQSSWTKFSKITAVLLGGIIASISLHLALAFCIGFDYVIPTSLFSIFIVWTFFMIMIYWIKSAWKSWLILLLITGFSVLYIYFVKN